MGFEGKKLLVLGGIRLACEIVERAQACGAYVAVADYYVDSPAKAIADEPVLIDATDADALVEYCKANSIDGVTTGFVDILMPVCREVCDRLGLPYYATRRMIQMSTDKAAFKRACETHGVPVPVTFYIGSDVDAARRSVGSYPVFVKPLDASGSRGAGRCRDERELELVFADAVSFSASGNAVVEECLTGTEFLLDYVGVGGEFRLLSMFDRYMCPKRNSAVNYSDLCFAPSNALESYYSQVDRSVRSMFKAEGFKDGLIFLQGYSDGHRIAFYEMGCRLGGSFFKLEQAILGENPVDMVVRYALTGKMLQSIDSIAPRSADFSKTAMVCNYLLSGDRGTIAEVKGVNEVVELDSFVGVIEHRGVGCSYEKDSTIDKPALSFYMACDDLSQAKADLEIMNGAVDVLDADGRSLLMEKFDPKWVV